MAVALILCSPSSIGLLAFVIQVSSSWHFFGIQSSAATAHYFMVKCVKEISRLPLYVKLLVAVIVYMLWFLKTIEKYGHVLAEIFSLC